MEKVILDQNVLSDLVDDGEFLQLLKKAENLGLMKPVWNQVHLDQSNAIKDVSKRDRTLLVINSGSTTITYGHDDELSRPGWSDPAPDGALEKILGNQTPKKKHKYDALLALTASREAKFLVTDEKRLKNRCRELGIPVINSEEFKSYLESKIKTL